MEYLVQVNGQIVLITSYRKKQDTDFFILSPQKNNGKVISLWLEIQLLWSCDVLLGM